MDYYPYGDIRLDEKAGSFNEQRKFAGHEYDADTALTYMNARYYNGKIGRFVSQDPAFLLVGDPSFENRYQRSLEVHLSDPQALNSYSYALNNPMVIIDPTGELSLSDIGIAMSNSQRSAVRSFHNFAKSMEKYGPPAAGVAFVSDTLGSVSDNVANIYDPRKSSGERLLAFGLAVLDTSSGGKGSGASKAAISVGEKVPGFGKVIENFTGKITGFFRADARLPYHGLDRTIERGVSPGVLLNTVKNPLITFEQANGNIYRLTKEAAVVLDRNGKVVTTYASKDFFPKVTNLIDKLTK